MFPLEIDEDFDVNLYRYDDDTDPYIEFSYIDTDGNLHKEDGHISLGLSSIKYDSISLGINIKNFNVNYGITIIREIIENSAVDDNWVKHQYVAVDWGESTDNDFGLIISKYNDYSLGTLKIKVYIEEYPDIVGYIN